MSFDNSEGFEEATAVKRGRKPSVLAPLAREFEKAQAEYDRAVKAVEKVANVHDRLAAAEKKLAEANKAFQEALNRLGSGAE